MRIAYISNSILPSQTANSIHVMKICQAFAENGHDVYLLAPEINIQESPETVYEFYGVRNCFNIVRYAPSALKGKMFFNAIKIQKILLQIKPDLVYGRFAPGCALATLYGYPTVYESHSPIWTSSTSTKIAFWLMRHSRSLLKLVVISNALKQMYMSQKLIKNEKILVAHDGADEHHDFNGILLPSDKLRIGYFGHLYPGRGIDIIIELAKHLPEYEFHIVGGNTKDIAYWKEQTTQSNLFFHGFIPPKDVYRYRNSCDILIAPYQNEVAVAGGEGNTSAYMSPLKIFEYMSSKKAIIASDLPVLREVLNQTNSILVDNSNLGEWIQALHSLSIPATRQKIAEQAYVDFINGYTWQKRAQTLIDSLHD